MVVLRRLLSSQVDVPSREEKTGRPLPGIVRFSGRAGALLGRRGGRGGGSAQHLLNCLKATPLTTDYPGGEGCEPALTKPWAGTKPWAWTPAERRHDLYARGRRRPSRLSPCPCRSPRSTQTPAPRTCCAHSQRPARSGEYSVRGRAAVGWSVCLPRSLQRKNPTCAIQPSITTVVLALRSVLRTACPACWCACERRGVSSPWCSQPVSTSVRVPTAALRTRALRRPG